MSLITTVYKPSMTAGQLYARPYGSAVARTPVGNVLELVLSHEEDVQRQQDMTKPGGGTYAKVSRISQCNLAMKLADWNPVNFARAVFGTVGTVAAGALVDQPYTAKLGGLIRLARPSPSAVTVKIGVTTINPVGNYEVRPGGIYIYADAADIDTDDALLVSSTHPEHVNIEALTTSAPELELFFEGLNEADSGKAHLVDIWRVGQGITQQLGLVQTSFGTLDVNGEVLVDPAKTGVGISRFYRSQMV